MKINMNSVAAKGKLGPQPVSVLGKNKSFPVKLPPPPLTPASLLKPAGMGRRRGGQAYSPVSSAACQNPASLRPNPIPTSRRSRQVKGLQSQSLQAQKAGSRERRFLWWPWGQSVQGLESRYMDGGSHLVALA